MEKDELVLVVIVNNKRDLHIAHTQNWYRIPVDKAPAELKNVRYIAFYQTSAFGKEKWKIDYWAEIKSISRLKRSQLLPLEKDHPDADKEYYKVNTGEVKHLPESIKGKKGRRILFVTTNLTKFKSAKTVDDLFSNIKKEKNKMAKIGVIHYNFPGLSFTDYLKYAKDTGYEYLELAISDVWTPEIDNPEAKAEEVRKEVESFGLKVSALSAGNDFVVLDEEKIKAQVERMNRICGLGNILGAYAIRTEGGSPKDSVPEEKWVDAMAGCLVRCVDAAEKNNIKLAVDNHGYITNDGDLQVELFEKVGSDWVGANMDTMNYRWAGHTLQELAHYYEIVAPYTFHTHMKDGTGSLSNYKGAALGDGEIDLEYAVKCLKDAEYDGVWCSEYEGPEGADTGFLGYTKCYKWLKENI
ncbi:TIM barrel protein [Candidatus Poribacteria bacterium]|nr:TIM barrel protein [Candidatus Poribacteria bacterium]